MDDEINLLDYIKVIMKWKWLIIGITIISMLIAFVNSKMQPKMYKAEATLISMNPGLGGLAQAISSSPFAAIVSGGNGEDGNVGAILKSRALARTIVESYDIKKIIFKNRWDQNKKVWIGEEPTLDDAASKIRSGLKNGSEKSIEVVWSDPETAAIVANSYAKGMIKFFNEKAMGINVQILDEAVPSNSPIQTNIKLNLAISFIFGLFISVFLSFFVEYSKKLLFKV